MYQVQTETGKVYRTHARDGVHACERVADLYRVTAVAWRVSKDPRDSIHIGIGREE